MSLASPVQWFYSVDNTLLEKKSKQTSRTCCFLLILQVSHPMFAKMSPLHIWLVRWPFVRLNWAPSFPTTCTSQKKIIQHIKWTNLKLEVSLWAFHGSPFSLPWIFSKLPPSSQQHKHTRHGTPRNKTRYRFDETLKYWEQPPKKRRTKIKRWQNSIWQNMNQWANVSLKYPSCFQSRLQEATTIFKIWFGYVWLFHNETSKDLLHAQQHLKTWVLLQKGVALPRETRATSKWGVLCIDGPAEACMSIHTQSEQASARRHLAKLV